MLSVLFIFRLRWPFFLMLFVRGLQGSLLLCVSLKVVYVFFQCVYIYVNLYIHKFLYLHIILLGVSFTNLAHVIWHSSSGVDIFWTLLGIHLSIFSLIRSYISLLVNLKSFSFVSDQKFCWQLLTRNVAAFSLQNMSYVLISIFKFMLTYFFLVRVFLHYFWWSSHITNSLPVLQEISKQKSEKFGAERLVPHYIYIGWCVPQFHMDQHWWRFPFIWMRMEIFPNLLQSAIIEALSKDDVMFVTVA